jgi:hypothetical protein
MARTGGFFSAFWGEFFGDFWGGSGIYPGSGHVARVHPADTTHASGHLATSHSLTTHSSGHVATSHPADTTNESGHSRKT